MEKTQLFSHFSGKKILVTGHTGFKGSWMSIWLKKIGAEVVGLSLPPNTQPNLFEAANIAQGMNSIIGDITDFNCVKDVFNQHQPEIVFHLAAQSLVRPSFHDPVGTYATNVLGTAHVLEAARYCDSVKTLVVVTSDKCYLNNEGIWGYREADRLGGKDPYSASKACAELVVDSYRNSIYKLDNNICIASARGGNVVGGGDWSIDRLVPDIVAALQKQDSIILRNPTAIRPWQHVLELIYGYLLLAYHLNVNGQEFAEAWNFGPSQDNEVTVESLTRTLVKIWGAEDKSIKVIPQKLPEAHFLKLDATKSRNRLRWKSVLNIEATLDLTAQWYRQFFYNPANALELVDQQIDYYLGLIDGLPG